MIEQAEVVCLTTKDTMQEWRSDLLSDHDLSGVAVVYKTLEYIRLCVMHSFDALSTMKLSILVQRKEVSTTQ